MPNTASDSQRSPFASILAWSTSWPDWQQDALRRIVESGSLSHKDLTELTVLCRAKHGLLPANETSPKSIPLSAAHTPGGVDSATSVSLSKLSSLQNIGRLSSDQEILFGSAPGLTVIYGENGAGKSGYARVIKKACRARGTQQEIKPDAFSAASAGPAEATIVCRIGAEDHSVDWTDGSAADPRLSNIFVFDSFSARAHVGEDGPACFKPRGLDVLPELAKACDAIKTELQTEIGATYTTNRKTAQGWKYKSTTPVGKLVNGISESTKLNTVDTAAMFTDDDEKRLSDIVAILSADPKTKAADTTAAAMRLRTYAETTKSRATSVDDTAMQSLDEAIKEAEITSKAAEAAAGPDLKESDLPGTCNDVWRELWNAAQKFSETAVYPDKPFPVAEAGAKCVLCQQDLLPDSINRFDRFNKFVADETRKNAESAKSRIDALKGAVDPLRPIMPGAVEIKADLQREAEGKLAVVEAFAQAVDARIAHAKKCLHDGIWSDAPVLPASPCEGLITLAESLESRAEEELSAADPETAQALTTERDELTDRKWLAAHKDDVQAQITRHIQVAKLKKCLNDCTTNAITLKSGELHDAHVTVAFCTAFEAELATLGMTTLPVKLDVARGAKGERRFGVKLNGTTAAKVGDIASEGEHRCIALAAFMAELSQASHKSALVFDDPVSSLDHKRREAIASRLVTEATHRQVVVFTHDLAFICDLERAAGDAKRDFAYRQVEWVGDRPGRILPHLSWRYKSDKEQIKEIKDLIAEAVRVQASQGESEYREKAQVIINRLRGSCERLVEQTLLCGAVKRHDSQVIVSKTPGIAAVEKQHWDAVHEVWKACSHTTDGHAAAFSGPKAVPTPDEFSRWVAKIEQVIQEVKTARMPKPTASI